MDDKWSFWSWKVSQRTSVVEGDPAKMKIKRFIDLAEEFVEPQPGEVETYYPFTRQELIDLFLLVRKEIIEDFSKALIDKELESKSI
jgi:hypothetical protein